MCACLLFLPQVRQRVTSLLLLLLLLHGECVACAALDGVANFRAVSPSLSGIYRSAKLEQAMAELEREERALLEAEQRVEVEPGTRGAVGDDARGDLGGEAEWLPCHPLQVLRHALHA